MVRFDAYTATLFGAKPDDLMQILFDHSGTSSSFYKSKGFHTFGERIAIKDASGHEFGAVQYGGKQGDRLMFEVKGEYTPEAAERLRARFPHRVTRVDSCADFDAPDAFSRLYGACTAVKKANRIIGGKAGDWDDFPEKGRTLYLGSVNSPTRARLYEKGLQPEYVHLERPHWVRLESQVRPKSREAGQVFAHLSPLEVWGAARWTRDLAAAVLQEHVDPHPAGTTYRLSDSERAMRWCCKQYGAVFLELAADLGGWDVFGLTVGEMMRELQERAPRNT